MRSLNKRWQRLGSPFFGIVADWTKTLELLASCIIYRIVQHPTVLFYVGPRLTCALAILDCLLSLGQSPTTKLKLDCYSNMY